MTRFSTEVKISGSAFESSIIFVCLSDLFCNLRGVRRVQTDSSPEYSEIICLINIKNYKYFVELQE